jgi:hypothetical protein
MRIAIGCSAARAIECFAARRRSAPATLPAAVVLSGSGQRAASDGPCRAARRTPIRGTVADGAFCVSEPRCHVNDQAPAEHWARRVARPNEHLARRAERSIARRTSHETMRATGMPRLYLPFDVSRRRPRWPMPLRAPGASAPFECGLSGLPPTTPAAGGTSLARTPCTAQTGRHRLGGCRRDRPASRGFAEGATVISPPRAGALRAGHGSGEYLAAAAAATQCGSRPSPGRRREWGIKTMTSVVLSAWSSRSMAGRLRAPARCASRFAAARRGLSGGSRTGGAGH